MPRYVSSTARCLPHFPGNKDCYGRGSPVSSPFSREHNMNASVQTWSRNQGTTSAGSNGRSRQSDISREQWLNVGDTERIVSASAGAILVAQGLVRRDLVGWLIAGIGGALAYRGATGHCHAYEAAGLNSAAENGDNHRAVEDRGTRICQSLLINKSPEELYAYWHNFENLPNIMTHLESVRVLENGRSHWVAKAPMIAGGQVEWDAEVTADEPNSRIAWRALPGGDIEHRGSIKFAKAAGDRGTNVKVVLEYYPPAGQLGRWVAKLFGEEPEQQIHDDLRNFKRIMEIGEVLTIIGQSHGTCTGKGKRYTEWGANNT
jgi:uncharacterized membrane protein